MDSIPNSTNGVVQGGPSAQNMRALAPGRARGAVSEAAAAAEIESTSELRVP